MELLSDEALATSVREAAEALNRAARAAASAGLVVGVDCLTLSTLGGVDAPVITVAISRPV